MQVRPGGAHVRPVDLAADLLVLLPGCLRPSYEYQDRHCSTLPRGSSNGLRLQMIGADCEVMLGQMDDNRVTTSCGRPCEDPQFVEGFE